MQKKKNKNKQTTKTKDLGLFGTLQVVRNFNLSPSLSTATHRAPHPERAEWKLSY